MPFLAPVSADTGLATYGHENEKQGLAMEGLSRKLPDSRKITPHIPQE